MIAQEHLAAIGLQLRAKVQSPVTGPCDLDLLCEKLGLALHKRPLHGLHGCLIDEHGALTVVLNVRDSHQKQRFTLAHEIGHFLLGHTHTEGELHREEGNAAEGRKAAERDCDTLAAELLMPEIGFSSLILGNRPSIQRITELADTFDVSVESAAVRYGQLTEVSCQVSKWHQQQDKFTCAWVSGPVNALKRGMSIGPQDRAYGIREAFEVRSIANRRENVRLLGGLFAAQAQSQAFGSGSWRYALTVLNVLNCEKVGGRSGYHPRR